MEQYLKDLQKNKDGTYTLSSDKYTELLDRYSRMKGIIEKCNISRKDWEFAIDQHKKLTTDILLLESNKNMEIMGLKKELEEKEQKITNLNQNLEKALEVADKAVKELKDVRAKCNSDKK